MEFLEKFAILLFIKCIEILWKKNFKRLEIDSILSKIIPNYEEGLKHYNISELIDKNKFFEIITIEEEVAKKLYEIINQGWRILQRYEVSLKTTYDSNKFIHKRIFKFEKRYFDLLFDIRRNRGFPQQNSLDVHFASHCLFHVRC